MFSRNNSLVNMLFLWSDTKDLGFSGSEENGDLIEIKELGGGTFGVVYLHTGVRGLVYLPTPGPIPYRSSLESSKSVAQSMDADLSGTNTVSFSRFIKHSALSASGNAHPRANPCRVLPIN